MHDWVNAMVPDGHDRVNGWRCRRCGEEVEDSAVRFERPPPDRRVWRVSRSPEGARAQDFSCDEVVAWEVLLS